jgi:hypothetical protein
MLPFYVMEVMLALQLLVVWLMDANIRLTLLLIVMITMLALQIVVILLKDVSTLKWILMIIMSVPSILVAHYLDPSIHIFLATIIQFAQTTVATLQLDVTILLLLVQIATCARLNLVIL